MWQDIYTYTQSANQDSTVCTIFSLHRMSPVGVEKSLLHGTYMRYCFRWCFDVLYDFIVHYDSFYYIALEYVLVNYFVFVLCCIYSLILLIVVAMHPPLVLHARG